MHFFTNNFSKYTSLPIVNLLFTYFLYSWYQPPEYKQNFSEIIVILFLVTINISLGLFVNQWVRNKRNINSKFPGEDKVMILSILVSIAFLGYVSFALGRTDTIYQYDVGNIIDSIGSWF
jgi:hypothetical protein|tara:strand:+ start:239 stop:598 length:360 start_codon:yes stop_codon:yes gene_type:complete